MPESSVVKTLEQGRASQAYKYVEEAKEKSVDTQKEYKSYVKKMPVMIKTNGLGQTVAFIKSKSDKEAYGLIYRQLGEWLKKCPNAVIGDRDTDLVKAIVNLESREYRMATAEALALLSWLRRFADGLIAGEAEGS